MSNTRWQDWPVSADGFDRDRCVKPQREELAASNKALEQRIAMLENLLLCWLLAERPIGFAPGYVLVRSQTAKALAEILAEGNK